MMKNILYTILIGILLASCSGDEVTVDSVIESGDLSMMNKHRDDLKSEENELFVKLQKLEAAMSILDTVENFPEITVKNLQPESFVHYVDFPGDIATDRNVVIFPEYAGTLNKVLVRTGQKVSKGQLLAQIDDGGLSMQRAAMQVQVDLAKTTFEKRTRLWEKNIGSEIEYLQSKTAYESQQASLEQMDGQLAKTSVRAPFSGEIDEVITKQGSVVAPGMNQLFRLVSNRDMYVEVSVPEVHLPTMEKGRKAVIEIPVLGIELNSEIRSVASFIHPANRTFKIQLPVDDKKGRVKPNLNAKVKINDYSNEKALLIPQSVVNENADGKEFVYSIEERNDNIAVVKRTFVELGKTKGDEVEVKEGLKVGDEVVIEGARAVTNNQTVIILESK